MADKTGLLQGTTLDTTGTDSESAVLGVWVSEVALCCLEWAWQVRLTVYAEFVDFAAVVQQA